MNRAIKNLEAENARLRNALLQIKDAWEDPDISGIHAEVITLNAIDDELAIEPATITKADMMDMYIIAGCWGAICGIAITLMRMYL